jgi:hypothetical protein
VPPDPLHPPTLKLRVRQYDFTITRRFHAGQVITDGEAYALNQLLMENVRNNTTPWVHRAEQASPNGILSHEQVSDLQTKIAQYATTYRFRPRVRTRGLTPIDLALDELAFAQARTEGHHAGLAAESVEVKMRYRQLLLDPTLQTKARELVLERQKAASNALEELLDVG